MSRLLLSRTAALAALTVAAGVPAGATTAAAAPAGAATAAYTITDLGSLGGGVTHGLAINAVGQVTGDSFLAKKVQVPCEFPQSPNQKTCLVNLDHAFFWSNGTMTDLGTLGGDNSQGLAINGSGAVVGESQTKTGASPFLSNARIHKLTALNAMNQALGINDSGQIAGQCNELPANPEVFACVVSSNGTTTTQLGDSVPPLGNSPFACSEAVAINNTGQALAYCSGPGIPESGPVVWTNGTPAVACTFSTDAHPTAFNNNGQVVGTVFTSTGGEDGWLCRNGTLTDLGPGFFPAAINDSGVIVGGPFIDSGGTVQNLNTLIPAGSPDQIQSATGINDNGQIIANATDTATGQSHALLLTPH